MNSVVEQELSREKTKTNAFQTRKSRTPPVPRYQNLHMSTDVLKLAFNIQVKIDKFTQLLSKIDNSKNKQSESYVNLIPVYSMPQKGEGGKGQKEIHSLLEITNEEREKRIYNKKKSRETIESCKQPLSRFEIQSNTYHERKPDKVPSTFRLQPICYMDVQDTEQQPFHVKSSWIPPIQRSVALETYLEKVKMKLAETPLVKPKNNLPPAKQQALKELINNKEIILTKSR